MIRMQPGHSACCTFTRFRAGAGCARGSEVKMPARPAIAQRLECAKWLYFPSKSLPHQVMSVLLPEPYWAYRSVQFQHALKKMSKDATPLRIGRRNGRKTCNISAMCANTSADTQTDDSVLLDRRIHHRLPRCCALEQFSLLPLRWVERLLVSG